MAHLSFAFPIPKFEGWRLGSFLENVLWISVVRQCLCSTCCKAMSSTLHLECKLRWTEATAGCFSASQQVHSLKATENSASCNQLINEKCCEIYRSTATCNLSCFDIWIKSPSAWFPSKRKEQELSGLLQVSNHPLKQHHALVVCISQCPLKTAPRYLKAHNRTNMVQNHSYYTNLPD